MDVYAIGKEGASAVVFDTLLRYLVCMNSLPEKGIEVNYPMEDNGRERRLNGLLIYALVFLTILLLAGLFELKRVAPAQRPFELKYEENTAKMP